MFEDYIYGVTYINNFVFRVNKFGKGPMENLTTGMNHATDIVLYHRNKQPESEYLGQNTKTQTHGKGIWIRNSSVDRPTQTIVLLPYVSHPHFSLSLSPPLSQ